VEYQGSVLEINAIDPKETEAPVWKMQQRKHWVAATAPMEEVDAYRACAAFGHILDVRMNRPTVYVKFLRAESPDRALKTFPF
jgi:hypothetical protein